MDAEDTMNMCAFDKLSKMNVPHILEKIFFSLDLGSFLRCLEVSEGWKDLLISDAFKKRGRTVYRVKISEEVRYASSDGN